MFRDENAAVGLPIRMVVLTIVGMVGLAAMIMFISDMIVVPKSMHANIIGIDNSNISSVIYANGNIYNITVEVIDVNGGPVEKATIVLYGLDSAASARESGARQGRPRQGAARRHGVSGASRLARPHPASPTSSGMSSAVCGGKGGN